MQLTVHMILFSAHLLAETETHEGKRKVEALWPIFKLVLCSYTLDGIESSPHAPQHLDLVSQASPTE